MEEMIFKQMIEDSPVPYFYAKIIRNELGECIGLKMEKVNNSFKKFFNVQDVKNMSSFHKFNGDENNLIVWINNNNESEVKKLTRTSYVKEVNLYCKIVFYQFASNYLYVNIIGTDSDKAQLPKSMRQGPIISWIKDLEGRYLDVSQTFRDYRGQEYIDIIGKTDYELIKSESAKQYILEDKEVIRTNKVQRYKEYYGVGKNILYYETIKWPFRDEKTDIVIGTIGIIIDISGDIELLKNIMSNKDDCYRLVDNTSDTIVIDGIEYDLNEIPSEITRVLDNGNLKWLDTKNVACDSKNGDTCNSLCIVKDITESKSKEMEIEKLRLDFFTNLSHELRTPINLILSSLQVLELKKSDNKEEDYKFYRKYLKIIKQNGFRLLKLVNNLIDSTKLDSGSFSYNPKNMNIIKCVEDICLSVCDFAKHNNIELIFDTDVEERIISFDMDDLERIVLNLISNAIKFSKEDGSILVSIDTSDLNEVKISVKDDGIGIPNDKLDVIFNKFEQVKSKMKNEREGSGIGLSLVKSLVQMHNGRIEVKSKVGQGSEFMVFLPNKLTENEVIIKEEKNIAFNNVYNMEVEFSDIY